LLSLVGAGLMLVLNACVAEIFRPGADHPADAPPEYSEADAATLAFELESVGCCYIEGVIQAVEVDGPMDAAWRIEDGSTARVPPGDYTVTFYEQVCDGSCDWLGQPTNHCSLVVAIGPGDHLTFDATFPLDQPCVVDMGA
jgi:hypothetical protein